MRNKSRAKVWDAMSDDQKAKYITNTTDKGNKRSDALVSVSDTVQMLIPA